MIVYGCTPSECLNTVFPTSFQQASGHIMLIWPGQMGCNFGDNLLPQCKTTSQSAKWLEQIEIPERDWCKQWKSCSNQRTETITLHYWVIEDLHFAITEMVTACLLELVFWVLTRATSSDSPNVPYVHTHSTTNFYNYHKFLWILRIIPKISQVSYNHKSYNHNWLMSINVHRSKIL